MGWKSYFLAPFHLFLPYREQRLIVICRHLHPLLYNTKEQVDVRLMGLWCTFASFGEARLWRRLCGERWALYEWVCFLFPPRKLAP